MEIQWHGVWKKSEYKLLTKPVHYSYISGEQNTNPMTVLVSAEDKNKITSINGAFNTDYFCVMKYHLQKEKLCILQADKVIPYHDGSMNNYFRLKNLCFFRTAEVRLKFCQKLHRWVCTWHSLVKANVFVFKKVFFHLTKVLFVI